MNWYKLITKECHTGNNTKCDKVIYLWANDIIHALNKYKKLSGVPRNKLPNVIVLNKQQVSVLKRAIIEEKNLNIEKGSARVLRTYSSFHEE